jgi:succinylglutamate desuccinylase
LPRVLGTYGGHTDGPLVICLGGIHGNEPAGVVAVQRVLDWLRTRQPSFRGELIALTGNRAALLRKCRYIAHDLNRAWSPERISAFRQGSRQNIVDPEDEEQRELLIAIRLYSK